MALQTQNAGLSPSDAFNNIRGTAAQIKAQAQNVLVTLQGAVTTPLIFQILDTLGTFITQLTAWEGVAGLNAYATAQGYAGTLSADCATAITAAQACITWVVQNFPASGGFLQAESLNADGSRTPRSFTTTQTAGLQTALTSFIATIS